MLQPDQTAPPAPAEPAAVPAPVAARARRPELDALRVAAMAGVVAIHTLGWPLAKAKGSAWYLGFLVADRVANAVCVPAFLFLTGLLVWGSPGGARHTGSWWWRRTRVVFLPYLAWSAVYYVVRPLLYPPALAGRAGLADAAVRVIAGTTFYHLYFPPLLLAVYLLAPLARLLLARGPAALAVATLVAQALLIAAHHGVPMPPEAREFVAHAALLVPFASAGAWFAGWERRGASRRGILLALGAAGAALVVAQAFGVLVPAKDLVAGYPLRLVGMLAVAASLAAALALLGRHDWQRRPRLTRGLADVAAHSYGVYLAHPLVLGYGAIAFASVWGQRAWGRPGLFAAAYAVVVGLTLALVASLRRSPVTSWTV